MWPYRVRVSYVRHNSSVILTIDPAAGHLVRLTLDLWPDLPQLRAALDSGGCSEYRGAFNHDPPTQIGPDVWVESPGGATPTAATPTAAASGGMVLRCGAARVLVPSLVGHAMLETLRGELGADDWHRPYSVWWIEGGAGFAYPEIGSEGPWPQLVGRRWSV